MIKAKVRSKAEWKEIISEFDNSQASIKSYCVLKGIKIGTFKKHYYNFKKLADLPNLATAPKLRLSTTISKEKKFIGIRLGQVGNRVQIELSNGIKLETVVGDIIGLIKELTHVV